MPRPRGIGMKRKKSPSKPSSKIADEPPSEPTDPPGAAEELPSPVLESSRTDECPPTAAKLQRQAATKFVQRKASEVAVHRETVQGRG